MNPHEREGKAITAEIHRLTKLLLLLPGTKQTDPLVVEYIVGKVFEFSIFAAPPSAPEEREGPLPGLLAALLVAEEANAEKNRGVNKNHDAWIDGKLALIATIKLAFPSVLYAARHGTEEGTNDGK